MTAGSGAAGNPGTAPPDGDSILDSLTPTQDLIMDVLSARYRLGESSWPIHRKLAKQVDELGRLGLVNDNVGPQGYLRVDLTSKALQLLKIPRMESVVLATEPAEGEYIPPANRDYADRIAAFLQRLGAEKMAYQAVGRLFGTERR